MGPEFEDVSFPGHKPAVILMADPAPFYPNEDAAPPEPIEVTPEPIEVTPEIRARISKFGTTIIGAIIRQKQGRLRLHDQQILNSVTPTEIDAYWQDVTAPLPEKPELTETDLVRFRMDLSSTVRVHSKGSPDLLSVLYLDGRDFFTEQRAQLEPSLQHKRRKKA